MVDLIFLLMDSNSASILPACFDSSATTVTVFTKRSIASAIHFLSARISERIVLSTHLSIALAEMFVERHTLAPRALYPPSV